MSYADPVPRLPIWLRIFFRVPVIGWVARDLTYGDKDTIWYALVAFVSLWLSLILLFGLPGLYIPAVTLVPLMFGLLLLITRG